MFLSSPVFSVLKKRYPHLEIDAYIYDETLPMLEGHPAIANFLLYDKKWKKLPSYRRFFEEWKILRRIRNGRYDLVINLTEGDRGAIAAKVSRAPYAVGFDPEGGGMMRKKYCYTHLIQHTPHPRHTVEKQLDALRCLGLHPTLEERDLFFHIPEKARLKVKALLEEKGVEIGRYIHVHPVSRWMFKTVPPATIGTVLGELHQKGFQIVLTASPDPQERAMNQAILSQAPFAVDLSGQISLKELGAVIEMSRMLLSVDSVPVHLASSLKKPTVALFGPTCEKNWGPYRNPAARVVVQNVTCRPCYRPGCGGSGKSDCLETLSAEQIIAAVDDILQTEVFTEVGGAGPLISK